MARSTRRPAAGPGTGNASQRIAPVPRESTVDLIAIRLRQAIYEGKLPAGGPLGEAELAEQLGVSRGPLREAAQRLVQEQLLTATRRRGLAVVAMGTGDVDDVYLARNAIERAACRALLTRDTGRTVRALSKIHQRMARATGRRDARAVGDADIEFHQALVDAAASPRLSRMMATLLIETRLCTFSLANTYRVRADLPDSHAVIIDAIRAGDEASLLAVIDHHLTDAVSRLTARSAEGTIASPEPARPRPLDPLDLPSNA